MTSVELLLYLTLGLWAAGARPRPREWTRAHWAALLWAAALAVSAAAAPEHRGEAAKFALRQIGGVALFFAAFDLSSAPRRAAILALAYAGGAVTSGLAGIAEAASPAVAEALLRFKTHPSVLEGGLRASGTLQYANLAAMSWGMALPLATLLIAARPGRAWRLATGAGVLVLAGALVESASRAGLATALVVLAAIAASARGRLRELRAPALFALASLAGLASVDLATRGGLAPGRRDRPWFDAGFRAEPPALLEAGGVVGVPLRARNLGRLRWRASGEHGISVGYVWLTDPAAGVQVAAALPRDVEPGETVVVEARVAVPRSAGRHRLRWLLIGGGLAWLSPRAGGATDMDVEVGPWARGPSHRQGGPAALLIPQRQPTRPELWRAGLALWRERPAFGVGPDNFRRLYAGKLGPHRLDERVHANSLYVEVLATLGVLGALSLLALGAALALAAARGLGSGDRGAVVVSLGAAGGLAAFFIHGLVDYGLEATAVYGAFWLLAALVGPRRV